MKKVKVVVLTCPFCGMETHTYSEYDALNKVTTFTGSCPYVQLQHLDGQGAEFKIVVNC